MGKKQQATVQPATTISLTDEEKTLVKSLESDLISLKCKVANYAVLQQAAIQDVARAEKALIEKISDLAKAHGIDPDDPNKGVWNFITKDLIFVKTH